MANEDIQIQATDPGPPVSDTTGLSPQQLGERPDLGGGDPGAGGVVDTSSPAPQGQPTEAQAQTIREAAARYGLDLSNLPDDHAAFVHLVRQAQAASQNDYYTSLGRQLAPRYRDIQGYLEQQRARAQPANAPLPFEAPEFDERWLNLVERDERTGAFKALPGVNPEFAERVQKYADWMQGFNRDPMSLIRQAIEHHATEIARKVFSEQHGQVVQTQTIQSIIEQNASWIYQADEQGRRYTDAQGNFLPTPEGARYVAHVRALAQAGVRDPRQQDAMARQLVSADIYAAQAQRAQQAQLAANPQSRAAVARPPVNPGQATDPGRRQVVPGATEPATAGRSLADLLREEMAAEGITDADFATV